MMDERTTNEISFSSLHEREEQEEADDDDDDRLHDTKTVEMMTRLVYYSLLEHLLKTRKWKERRKKGVKVVRNKRDYNQHCYHHGYHLSLL